jgi:oligopeptide transport system substrate-binding protein
MHKSKLSLSMAVLVVGTAFLVACEPEVVVEQVEVTTVVEKEIEVTRVVEGETVVETVIETVVETVIETAEVEVTPQPEVDTTVTLDFCDLDDIMTLDPQLAGESGSITYLENLVVNLTNYDLETSNVVPEAATSWVISEDGLVYTFHLRTDIPWVKYDPRTGEVVQEVDGEGNARFVTAHDFVYGIRRACDPDLGSYYSSIIAPLIKGCSAMLFAQDPDATTQDQWDAVSVSAPDEATLVIELEYPAGYFLSMTPMWTLAAAPQWAIEEHGEDWVEMGNFVGNGRYVLTEWVHNVRRSVIRNPLMPADMQGSGNIEKVAVNVVPDVNTAYALWLNSQVDSSLIPDGELQAHLEHFPDETDQIPDLGVMYLAFRFTKPPTDNVHVRRALSAAFDRERYLTDVLQGQGLPMTHFAPPGIFGAPPIDEVGIPFDPEFARAELAEAGYPDCEGFPGVMLAAFDWQESLTLIEFAQGTWSEVLGCDPALFQIELLGFRELLAAIAADVPDAEAPHMWMLGWGPDYPDENNWVGDVLWCENPERADKRPCSAADDLIVEARTEPDPGRRAELYRQIEEMFFGYEGEIPFMPMYVSIGYLARHAWLDRVPALFGGQQWYNWTIDQEVRLAARGE